MDERNVSARVLWVDDDRCSVEVYEFVGDDCADRHEVSFARRDIDRDYEVSVIAGDHPDWLSDHYDVVDAARRAWGRLDAGLP